MGVSRLPICVIDGGGILINCSHGPPGILRKLLNNQQEDATTQEHVENDEKKIKSESAVALEMTDRRLTRLLIHHLIHHFHHQTSQDGSS